MLSADWYPVHAESPDQLVLVRHAYLYDYDLIRVDCVNTLSYFKLSALKIPRILLSSELLVTRVKPASINSVSILHMKVTNIYFLCGPMCVVVYFFMIRF